MHQLFIQQMILRNRQMRKDKILHLLSIFVLFSSTNTKTFLNQFKIYLPENQNDLRY